MSWENRESSQSTPSDVGGRLRSTAATLEMWPEGAPIQGVRKGTRLLRVLVVDDDRDTANSLSLLVKLWGHEARVAYSGATALEAAAAYQPDVVLLDIAMPMMDGNEVARRLRRQTRCQKTLLIAISGYADGAHRLGYAMAGFDRYLIKPVELLILEELLLAKQDQLAESLATACIGPRTNGILIVDENEGVRGVLIAETR
jgi:CheY-like chemotaxis protein